MIRRLTSSPNPAAGSRLHDFLDIRVAVIAYSNSKAHAVEPREIAGSLTRQDQVVRRKCVLEVRARHLNWFERQGWEDLDGLIEPLPNAWLVPVADNCDTRPIRILRTSARFAAATTSGTSGSRLGSPSGHAQRALWCSSAASMTERAYGPA